MIYIERDQVDNDNVAIRPNDAWFELSMRATEKAVSEKKGHSADRNIYTHTEVRTSLEHLFHDKCAYCETKMTATADWEVEHFRPSGRVVERRDHPGYYWLVYIWENLYPSCPHCNQLRKDKPRWGDAVELPSGGKACRFPIADENTRAMKPSDDVDAEHRLLIDPCSDDPEDYLGYDPTGQIFALGDKPSGKITIDVFHLYRRRLRDLRQETVRAIGGLIKAIDRIADPDAVGDFQALLDEARIGWKQHAGVARYVASHPAEFGLDAGAEDIRPATPQQGA